MWRFLLAVGLVACSGSTQEDGAAAPPPTGHAVAPRPAASAVPAARPVAPPLAPTRVERAVFDLVDNRLLAHLGVAGGLYVDGGSAGFARYAAFGGGWKLGQVVAGERAARFVGQTLIDLPLAATPSDASGGLVLRLHLPHGHALALEIDGQRQAVRKLVAGWQTVRVGGLALRSGENRIKLDVGHEGGALAWAWLGPGDGPADRPAPFFDPTAGTVVLGPDRALATYLYLPPAAHLIVDPPRGCSASAVAAAGAARVTGELTAAAPRLDLAALAGRVIRLELRSDCAALTGLRLTVPGLAGTATTAPPPERVILWVMDTLRADRIRPVTPGARPEVPAFERLAAEGAVFRQAYVQGNESQTSHASLWSSLYPAVHGVRTAGVGGTDRLKQSFKLIGEVMGEAGLDVVGVTGNGMIVEDGGYAQGFDRFWNLMRGTGLRSGYVPGAKVLERAHEAIGSDWDRRFFLFIGTVDTHFPYIGHSPWLERYDPKPYHGPFKRWVLPRDLGVKPGEMGCHIVPGARDLERINAVYDSNVSYQDEVLGKLLRELDAKGLTATTMIVVTADHGDEIFEDGRCGHGGSLRESLVHVPLFMRYPPLIPPGTVIEEGVDVLDVLPTLAEALAQPSIAGAQGISLIPLVQRVTGGYVQPSYASQYEYAHALRIGRYKVRLGKGDLVLYDLVAHPEEKAPLTDAPEVRRFMRDAMGLFLAHRTRWKKRDLGVVCNMSPTAAAALGE